ncbi:MAG TPA: tetratricopeptide repeat protein [Bacteroidota bacterium]|nr:tetratricopeptide repeat protein [Bacteroidota bacterium]
MTDKPTNIDTPQDQSPKMAEHDRKLAAIMFTDIKDYSKKMEHNEAAAMSMLETHNQMMHASVQKHSGTVIKTVGDAFLVSFESVFKAIQCSIEVQQNFHDYNKGKLPEELITVRIGVHLGDIIVKNKDVFGEGVNIAARIQPLASPGGICISEDAMRQLRGKMELNLLKLGTGQLKNIELPVIIYKVILPWQKAELPALLKIKFALKHRKARFVAAAGIIGVLGAGVLIYNVFLSEPELLASDRSIVILPIQNIGEAENEYLADGITEDLISQVARIPEILVIAKSSSFHYRKSSLPDSTIANQLNIRFLLKGTLQLSGARANLRATLFDAKRNKEEWNEMFDIARNQIFETSDLIVQKISNRFGKDLKDIRRPSKSVSAEAYELYLRGLYHLKKSKKDDNALAIEYFSEAVNKDSAFTPAIVSLANAFAVHYENGWDQSEKFLSDAEMYCKKTLLIESDNAQAYTTLGLIEVLRGNQSKGLEYFQTAIKIDPNNATALDRLALLYMLNLNEPAKAITFYKKSQEIEPMNWLVVSNLGVGYGQLKNYPEAIKAFRRAIQLNPDEENSWINLGYVYERIGKYDSAIQCYQNAIQKNPLNPFTYEIIASPLLTLGKSALAESVLTQGINLMPNNLELIYLLGVTLTITGKKEDARRTLDEGSRLVEDKIKKNPLVGSNYALAGLFHARLGNKDKAISSALEAFKYDSTDNEVIMKIARVYALLAKKDGMIEFYRKAKAMNPEYDLAYLSTALDFEKYRNDPDLLFVARQ